MSRFYVTAESVRGNKIVISGEGTHHILEVMRLKKLDRVTTFDGMGREYTGFIADIKGRSLIIEITGRRIPATRDSAEVTLIQAITKKDKIDYIIEKATELGVRRIVPVITERTIPRWSAVKKAAQVSRWRKIVREASRQCGRADVPEVTDIKEFRAAVKDLGSAGLAMIAALSDDAGPVKDVITGLKTGAVTVAIGPEGDFTADEIDTAKKAGFRVIDLGPRVLKSDTAGLAVLAVINYESSK